MSKTTKVILAYSGGLDTSVICKWLSHQGYEVICYIADVGQRENFKEIKKKALQSGAKKVIIEDLKKEFATEFILPALGFNALYEGRYLLGTSLARPLIARGLVKRAKAEKTKYIAHGATGKGNDQVRFELSAYALDPKIKIIAPWRIKEFYSQIKGRKEAIEYSKKNSIPIKASLDSPWSSDENLYHISFEAGVLEDPTIPPDEAMFEYSKDIENSNDKPTNLSIEFKAGVPYKVNGKQYDLVKLIQYLNRLGGENGVGRIDIVESRFLGMKSRGVYETPGGTILFSAHQDLESLVLNRSLIKLKNSLMLNFSDLVYNGFWFSEEMDALLAFLAVTQKNVEGRVELSLHKGNVIIKGRESKKSLYQEKIASMEDDQGSYDISQADGFIYLNSIGLKLESKRNNRLKE